MKSCGYSVLKYMMFAINLIIFLAGIAVFVSAIWAYVNGESFQAIMSSSPAFMNSLILLIIVGGVLIVAGFFGCCGATKENRCMLGTYFVIVLVLFLVEIAIMIIAFVFSQNSEESALESINSTNVTGSTTPTLAAWNSIQSTFSCCGFNNASDWTSQIPGSCCDRLNAVCAPGSQDIYAVGCQAKISQYYWIIGGIIIAVLLTELVSMVFSCCLYRGVGDKYELV